MKCRRRRHFVFFDNLLLFNKVCSKDGKLLKKLNLFIYVVTALYGDGQADIFTGVAGIVCGLPVQRISKFHFLWAKRPRHRHFGGHIEIILGKVWLYPVSNMANQNS